MTHFKHIIVNITPLIMRYLSLIFLLAMGTACNQEVTPDYTILQGKLPVGTEGAQINYGDGWEDLSLAEDGTFIDTLAIASHQYVGLSLGEFSTLVYFSPKDKVTISADSVLSFNGSNAKINEYLYHFYQDDLVRIEGEFEFHEKIFIQVESDYVHYRDSIKIAKLSRLTQLPAGTEEFKDFHQKRINYEYQYDVARYPMYHSYYIQDYEPTKIITNFYQGVPMDNEADAKHFSAYRNLVDLIFDKRAEKLEESGLSTLEARLSVLMDIQSPTILHRQLKKYLFYFTVNEEDMEAMRDRMLALAKLEKTKLAITEHYEVISKLKPGTPAPYFNYENYAGGNTKLTDLKGKYVYIDMWATWCGPCIKEIPHLKKIEKEFHDAKIEFVSISVDEVEQRDNWRKMIENLELVGTQLLVDNGWKSDILQDYGIKGLPHFILLDDQGNIISANVEHPSDPKLKNRLQALGL